MPLHHYISQSHDSDQFPFNTYTLRLIDTSFYSPPSFILEQFIIITGFYNFFSQVYLNIRVVALRHEILFLNPSTTFQDLMLPHYWLFTTTIRYRAEGCLWLLGTFQQGEFCAHQE